MTNPRKTATNTDPDLNRSFLQGFEEAQGQTPPRFKVVCEFEGVTLRVAEVDQVHDALRVAGEFLSAGTEGMRVTIVTARRQDPGEETPEIAEGEDADIVDAEIVLPENEDGEPDKKSQ